MVIKNEVSRVEINVLRRSNSETDDYWDGNWLETEIRIHVSGFNCIYGTNLRVEELQRFYEDVITFNNQKKKEIEFTTMEEGLYLHLEVEPNGAINCKGKGKDDTGNSLEFKFQIDLISLQGLIGQLKKVLESYPLIGIKED